MHAQQRTTQDHNDIFDYMMNDPNIDYNDIQLNQLSHGWICFLKI